MGRRVHWVVAALATGWLVAAGAGAQVGSTTDIISGKVLGPPPARHPVSGATVSVMSLDTRITRSRVTNSDGRYAVVFPDGGGQYRIEIRSVGYAPATLIVSRQADEDRLVADVELNTAVPTIQTINVRARANNGRDAANAATTGLTLTPSQIEKLPIDGSDFATLAHTRPRRRRHRRHRYHGQRVLGRRSTPDPQRRHRRRRVVRRHVRAHRSGPQHSGRHQ